MVSFLKSAAFYAALPLLLQCLSGVNAIPTQALQVRDETQFLEARASATADSAAVASEVAAAVPECADQKASGNANAGKQNGKQKNGKRDPKGTATTNGGSSTEVAAACASASTAAAGVQDPLNADSASVAENDALAAAEAVDANIN